VKIVLLANHKSGRGLGPERSRQLVGSLRGDGHEVIELAVGESHQRLAAELAGAGALLLAGGDGTVHKTLDDSLAAGVPVYHVPCGNENLFAREFGMKCDAELLRRAVADGKTTRVDVGVAQELGDHAGPAQHFLLMCGIGPDAGVVERLTALRTKAVGHAAYIEPVLREILSPRLPRLIVEVDGRRVVDGRRGSLIIANSRHYGFRLDPAERASMTDGRLDVVFLPCGTSLGALWWCLRLRLGWRRRGRGYWEGSDISVHALDEAVYQLDGDAPRWRLAGSPEQKRRTHLPGGSEDGLRLRITVRPAALPVLVP
jgi:diacylglycerol kinase family enzyme